ncbi:ParA family protein [Deinococcus malanensis]|uniref:ParA family protein n=1 Tax=Deinococcus malanensis TaxID=1706855 RepID=UPI0036454B32
MLAALAADQLIVPVPTKDKGILGLRGVQRALRMYRRLRPDLSIGLYIPTMYDRRALHDRETLDTIRAQLSPVASEMSLRGAVWNDSWRAQKPVRLFDPSSDVVTQVQRVTDELIAAVGLPDGVTHG